MTWYCRDLAKDRLQRKQGNRCAICRREPGDGNNIKTLELDHCHVTNLTRGLLCGQCNRALGLFDEDPARLYAAIRYIRMWHKKHGQELDKLAASIPPTTDDTIATAV